MISTSFVRGATIFLGAFLIFQIQPLAGKHLLPYFGGSSSVFATSMLFFSGLLFLGYAYVFLLTKYSKRSQVKTHLWVIGASICLLAVYSVGLQSLFPFIHELSQIHASPTGLVLLSLFISIGLPYFVVSTTSPLVLYWHGQSSHAEPYTLYALSNIASFLALLSYPFIIEKYVYLQAQEYVWVLLFFVYAVGVYVLAKDFLKVASKAHGEDVHAQPPKILLRLQWVFLSAVPTFLLVATTTHITRVIAPVPLIWIVPLSVFLLTFVIAFKGIGGGFLNAVLVVVLSYFTLHTVVYGGVHVFIQALGCILFLAVVGVYFHALIYASRPHKKHLPLFFLVVSFGGFCGSVFPTLVAPFIFSDYYEFPIIVFLAGVLTVLTFGARYIRAEVAWYEILSVQGIVLFAFFSAGYSYIHVIRNYEPLLKNRNFYGVVKVQDNEEVRSLTHGSTLHGSQYYDEVLSHDATTYYTKTSGVGQIEKYLRTAEKGPLRVGVIGLGAGTMASYCEVGDQFTFYEIDARIVHIASTYFSYLAQCPDVTVKVGDGRIEIENENRAKFQRVDLLVVDAFSDDAIPTHLITEEALQAFIERVDIEHGVVAMHTSNRYLALEPIIFKIAAENGYAVRLVVDTQNSTRASNSTWVLLAQHEDVFVRSHIGTYQKIIDKLPLWTDQYTNVVPIIKFDILEVLKKFLVNSTT